MDIQYEGENYDGIDLTKRINEVLALEPTVRDAEKTEEILEDKKGGNSNVNAKKN